MFGSSQPCVMGRCKLLEHEAGEVCRDEKWVETMACTGMCLLSFWCQRASMGLEEGHDLSMLRTSIENPIPPDFRIF